MEIIFSIIGEAGGGTNAANHRMSLERSGKGSPNEFALLYSFLLMYSTYFSFK